MYGFKGGTYRAIVFSGVIAGFLEASPDPPYSIEVMHINPVCNPCFGLGRMQTLNFPAELPVY